MKFREACLGGARMNLTHAMMWRENAEVFRCRWGACRFEVTWAQMNGAGYHASKGHVMFISGEDFNKGETDEKDNPSNIETS